MKQKNKFIKERLKHKQEQIEANIFNAVKNVDTAKLLGWRDANGKHNFLDQFE